MTPNLADPALALACRIARYYESCSLTPYLDPKGVPTIGWGSTFLADGAPVTMDTPAITPADADELLLSAMAKAIRVVDTLVDRPLSPGQTGALGDFVYNLGAGNFEGSTLLKDLNAGQQNAAIAAQIERWDHAGEQVLGGLEDRRKTEALLFTTGQMLFFQASGTEIVPAETALST